MSVTILEALMNAEINAKTATRFFPTRIMPLEMAREQLHNAVTLLEKGYGVDTHVEPLLEKHGAVENVPELEPIE